MPFSLKHSLLALAAITATMTALPVAADEGTDVDNKYAVIFAYFNVGNDANPNINIRDEQFAGQIQELVDGPYNVLPLPRIIEAFKEGKDLPDRTVAITFDGADKSILDYAVPTLIKNDLPFTVFIPAQRVNDGKAPYMSWDDLRDLKKSKLVSFGLHPSSYGHLVGAKPEEIRRQINNSLSLIRKELNRDVNMMAYPFGEFDTALLEITRSMGIQAAFGQQSGVAHAADNLLALPRFTLTERYGDMERFRMTANAMPLPVTDISPETPYLETAIPAIGFTLPASLRKNIASLSCFSSIEDKPDMQTINNARVEIRLPQKLNEERPRLNCTMPVQGKSGADETRWRWYGVLYTIKPDALREFGMEIERYSSGAGYMGLE